MDILIHLMPDWFNVGLQLLSTFILFSVTSKFAWKPMKEFLQKRQDFVEAEIKAAQTAKAEAQHLQESATIEIEQARHEAIQIVEASQKQAKLLSEEILKQSREEAQAKLAKAASQIKIERKLFYSEIRRDVVSLALESAEKLLQKEISETEHAAFFEAFLSQVGDSHE